MTDKLYYGSSEVISETEVDGLIEITIAEVDSKGDNYKFLLTKHQKEATVLPEAYADGEVSAKKWAATTAKILQVLLDDNMRLADRSFIIQQVENNLDLKWRDAIGKKFGVDDVNTVSLRQVDETLKS
jgi:hypothetical protein